MTEPTTILGCGVAIWRDGCLLLGRREDPSKPAYGVYAMPGGKVDPGEWPSKAAAREVLEETGLQVLTLEPLPSWHWTDKWAAHPWLTIYFRAEVADGAPVAREPYKCAKWEWFDPEALPSPTWVGIEEVIEAGPAASTKEDT